MFRNTSFRPGLFLSVVFAALFMCIAVAAQTCRADEAPYDRQTEGQKAAAAPAPGTSSESPADSESGFSWFMARGLAGICGARSVWWGWVIAIFIYVSGLVYGSASTGATARAQMEAQGQRAAAPAMAFVYALVGTPIGFMIFWGLPGSVLSWVLLVLVVLIASSISSAAAAQA